MAPGGARVALPCAFEERIGIGLNGDIFATEKLIVAVADTAIWSMG